MSNGQGVPRSDVAPTVAKRLTSGARRTATSIGTTRIAEFVLFFLLTAAGGLPGLATIGPVPTAHLVLVAICGYAMLGHPTRRLGEHSRLVPLFLVALFYIGVVSVFADPTEFAADWGTRLLRMCAVTVMVFVIASGRIDVRSAIIGTFAALMVNIPLFYAGLVQDNYGGVLTGLIGDKNVAGLTYSIIGLLMLWVVRRPGSRTIVLLLSSSATWLTGSRTALAAFAAGIVWILLAPRLPIIGKWILGLVSAVVIDILAEDYSLIGRFSDRVGSDLLRARIDDASLLKVGESGFFGQGLGEAYVVIADETWFFHNSYWSALVEGGWPWTLFLVAVTVLVMLRPFSGRSPDDHYIAQAAAVALLVCAAKLGEVFFTNVWGLALGFGIFLMTRPREGNGAVGAPRSSMAPVPSKAGERT